MTFITPSVLVAEIDISWINLYLSLLVGGASSSKPSACFKSSIIDSCSSSWNLRFLVDIHEPISLIEVFRDVYWGVSWCTHCRFSYPLGIWLFGYKLTTIISDWVGTVNWPPIIIFLHAHRFHFEMNELIIGLEQLLSVTIVYARA